MSGNSRSNKVASIPLEELYKRSQQETDQRQYEAEVEDFLKEYLADVNNRDIDAINKHLEIIESALADSIDGVIDLVFGGSVAKKTYVNGLSDVDLLVRLKDTTLADKNPDYVLKYFERMLRDKFPKTDIKCGDLAVTVSFSDGHEIQLLPAVVTSTGYRISQPTSNSWSNVIRPDLFAKKLTEVNKACNGKVVPVVKLIKPLCDKLPESLRLSGYHVESLAIQAFEKYKGRNTLGEMVKHFLYTAQSQVLHSITDTTGQSRHVDDYLGESNNAVRNQISKAFSRLVNKIEQSENLRSIKNWKELLEL